ncbi:MAG: adenosylcobinamide-phosphate synthase CbiB [Peptococcaceae bacterium]|nr:adenosylcobinamide-phosphate synthase CbiB [Peptococcaceae bacterium]
MIALWQGLSSAFNAPFISIWLIFWAFVLDRVLGDPKRIPHPVVFIGLFIAWFEGAANRGSSVRRKLEGILLVIVTVVGAYGLTWVILRLLTRLNPWLGLLGSLWLLATTFASTSLAKAGQEIYHLLVSGDLVAARRKLSWIVGRDTIHLDTAEVTRGAVETVAENIVDGVTAPLFYALFGGAPLAMAYKAVNTLDSMVGYKSERYLQFGWAGARLDDVANYIPARLTALLLLLAAKLQGLDWHLAWQTLRRDASHHPSPNSGYSESAVAGALGVRLGGWNSYGGVKSLRAYMGEAKQELVPGHILAAIELMFKTGWLFLAGGLVLKIMAIVWLR